VPAEVGFYILSSRSAQQYQDFVCKLIEKIYREGLFCYIKTETLQQADQLDKLLWTFRAGSFIPHQQFVGEIPEYRKTILMGILDAPEGWDSVIVNLSSSQPVLTGATQRILEVLDSRGEHIQLGRERYRTYQKDGLKINTFKL
jgi:DNA polymerase III subunit chi